MPHKGTTEASAGLKAALVRRGSRNLCAKVLWAMSWRAWPTRPGGAVVTCGDAESGHTIPERLGRRRHRQSRGSRSGRPTGFDRERYKKRNTVERVVNRLKGFRAVATRCEKGAHIYFGTVTLAALAIRLRT